MIETRICKEFTFEASHQLPNHKGKCKNLHGHSYRVQVELSGEINLVEGASDEGMITDFGDLSEIVKTEVLDRFDHHHLNDLIVAVPTVEILAMIIFKIIRRKTSKVSRVRIYETATSYAEVVDVE